MVAEEWLGALWVQLVGSCSWTVILITRGSKPLMRIVGVAIITQTMTNLQKTRSHTYGKRKEHKMVGLRTKKGKRKCSLKIAKKGEIGDDALLGTASSQSVHSVAQSCCNPKDCSTPGFHVHHQLLELAQTHVHQVGDAIQPSHPLPSASPPAFNLSQHQGLF